MIRRVVETAAIVFGTLGWWGFVYPELCLLESSYEEEYVSDDEEVQSREDGVIITLPRAGHEDGGEVREVRIKSKIAEYVYQVRNREAEKEVKDDK